MNQPQQPTINHAGIFYSVNLPGNPGKIILNIASVEDEQIEKKLTALESLMEIPIPLIEATWITPRLADLPNAGTEFQYSTTITPNEMMRARNLINFRDSMRNARKSWKIFRPNQEFPKIILRDDYLEDGQHKQIVNFSSYEQSPGIFLSDYRFGNPFSSLTASLTIQAKSYESLEETIRNIPNLMRPEHLVIPLGIPNNDKTYFLPLSD